MTYEPAPVTNPLGRISFFLGVAIVALGLAFTLTQTALLASSSGVPALGALSLAHGVLSLALAITAVVTGTLGLIRPGLPRGFAAAGTALGASTLVGLLSTLLTYVIFQLSAG